ncbi:MAG: DUF1565 domain-containing protein [Oscillatoriales cyanobacterium C42_A2020_001]|nr:DUF1565 domain-containing protein [Leptolyngbyaceae cyanobacterium C42_A2020_001]
MKSITPQNRHPNGIDQALGVLTLWSSGWLSAGLVLLLTIGLKPEPAIAQSQISQQFSTAQTSNSEAATVLYVNPTNGDDTTADGSDLAPFKTITRALEVAQPNTTIQLAPGTYSTQTGESFPIALKPRVTLQGNADNRGQDVVIQGGGTFASPNLPRQTITILGGANHAALIGITITNPNPDGYGIQIESSNPTIASSTFTGNGRGGIILAGSSDSLIRNNFFYQNGANGISVNGTARSTIQENIFEQTEIGIVVDDSASPLIENNRITQNKTGVMVQGKGQPRLRNNSVENNADYGLRAIAKSQPDVASSGADANFFRNNGKQDISRESAVTGTPEKKGERSVETAEKNTAETKPASPASLQPETPKPRSVGNVVVPVVPIAQPAVSPGGRSDRPPAIPPRQPLAPSTEPKLSAKPDQPFPSASIASRISSAAFPTPTALSNRDSSLQPVKPIQVVRMEQPPADLPSASNEAPDSVEVNRSPQTQPILRPVPSVASQLRNEQTPRTMPQRPLLLPVPPAASPDDIPAPPPISRKATIPSAQLISPQPALSRRAIAPVSSRSIPIPVPPPETVQMVPASKVAPPQLVPLPISSQPKTLDTQSVTRLGSLLPVPNSDIPLGNIGDMPSVYSAQGGLNQSRSGWGTNNVGVAKYRVIVVATDNIQQEQTRSLVPNAFPVIYRGQRVMQAGAFGDRTKAEQLVAALSDQGLQAVVEPLR